jgi:hypothetical protein
MVPDTRLRLATVLKALDDIVTPAVSSDATFVHEQLALMRKSIQIVIDQIAHEYALTIRDAMECMALGDDLLALMPSSYPGRERLRALVTDGRELVPDRLPDRLGTESFLRDLKLAIEDATQPLFSEPQSDGMRRMQNLILDHGDRHTLRERAWTLATGFESDASQIPPVEKLIYGMPAVDMVAAE